MAVRGRRALQSWWGRIRPLALFVPWEVVWLLYVLTILVILPCIVRSKRCGTVPRQACIFCVTHVGGFDPLFVVRASRRWRMRAVFKGDERYPFVAFLFESVWRFRVSHDPEHKTALNVQTLDAVVRYLRGGGSAMIFPEGHQFWEGRLYPGVARVAHRANAPIIPVGLENARVYYPGAERNPLLRAVHRIIRETHRRGWVGVRFGEPIYPDSSQSEVEDVDRMMRAIERWFGEFYRTCYGLLGPTWSPNRSPLP